MTIKIVLDSMVDFPPEMGDNNFEILPIPIILGGKTYFDGCDISPEKILKNGEKNNFPTTSQIGQMEYQKCFEALMKAGDDFIYIALSSGLSGTYQTAMMVANQLLETYPEAKFKIIDSKSATIGMALMAYQAQRMIDQGYAFEKVARLTQDMADQIEIVFMVSDIEWLYKGGRVSRGAAILGDKLNIKPILDISDGSIQVAKKARGTKKAIKAIVELMLDKSVGANDQIFGIVHFNAKEEALYLKKQIEKETKQEVKLVVENIGSALTVHLGASGLGLVFLRQVPDLYHRAYDLMPQGLNDLLEK